MNKINLIGFNILAVGLLILGSLTNVVGYQSVQTSQQNLLKEGIRQKDLLFQAIIDLVNNREIQKAVLESQMVGGGLFHPYMKSIKETFPTLTKRHLNRMYFQGSVLLKLIGKTRINIMIQKEIPMVFV